MPRKQHPLDKLVKSASSHNGKKNPNTQDSFYADLPHAVDAKDAPEFARAYAGTDFDATAEGAELAFLEKHHAENTAEREAIKNQCASLLAQLEETPRYIRMMPKGSDDVELRTAYRHWDFTDQIAAPVLGTLTLFIWFMGAANVFAVLQSSGQPIFIERPWIAASLSMIAPAFSACIKFTHHIFTNRRAKKIFAHSIYASTVLLLLVWTVAFSLTFQGGVSAGIDWDTLGEDTGPDYVAIALVWVQLSAEICIGGALAIALGEKVAPYFPGRMEENPSWRSMDAVYKALTATLRNLNTQYKADDTRLSQLRSARDKHLYQHTVKSGGKH